jgi:hypothetical protein
MLFDCFISYLYMPVLKLTLGEKKNLHISLYFSASSLKHPDTLGSVNLLFDSMPSRQVCTTFGRELFALSAKHTHTHTHTHTHYFLSILSCCVVCVYCQIDPEILAFFAHLFSLPAISFDFPYSLKL